MKVSKIKPKIDLLQVVEDLNIFLKTAEEAGATQSLIIDAQDVVMDFRAHYKCSTPKCHFYNTNENCPPHGPSFESTQKMIQSFHFAILIGLKVPSTSVVACGKKDMKSQQWTPSLITKEEKTARRKLYEIVSAVESKAFYSGYYLATAFGGGPCKGTWCSEVPCRALAGEGCRYPLLARPSMEGVGIDVFGTVSKVGWDIYPIGKLCTADDVPHGLRVGVVFII